MALRAFGFCYTYLMQRQIITLGGLLIIACAISVLFISLLLKPAKKVANESDVIQQSAATSTPKASATGTTASATASSTATPAVADDFTDGPYDVTDVKSKAKVGTVKVIRSPEEVLLQFSGMNDVSAASHIFLAKDAHNATYIDLGSAKFADGVTIYDIPLDTDLSRYGYINIVEQNSAIRYAAQLK